MKPTVALCLFVHNDLPILKATLLHEIKWADQICILDMASSDGLAEFCQAWLRPGIDKYAVRTCNTVPDLGFAEARNACVEMATTDWVLSGSADTVMDWAQHGSIHKSITLEGVDVLYVDTVNKEQFLNEPPSMIEFGVKNTPTTGVDTHRILIRRNSNVRWKGYIHEELYRGEVNCAGEAKTSGLRRFHFPNWGDSKERRHVIMRRYMWMLHRAKHNPELQCYTNAYWYNEWYAKNQETVERLAAEYERGRQVTA